MAELVDAGDSKSPGGKHLVGSSPTIRTILIHLPVKDKPIKFNFFNKDQFVEKFFEISSKKSTNNALTAYPLLNQYFFQYQLILC